MVSFKQKVDCVLQRRVRKPSDNCIFLVKKNKKKNEYFKIQTVRF